MDDVRAVRRGRPRLFDEEEALDELTALFWQQGYAQTSVADLVAASGVHKPSLYRVFGSKEEVFARVLRRYFDARMQMFTDLVDRAGPGIDGIHAFLSMMRDDIVTGSSQHGCLLVASSIELGGTTPGFEDFGSAYRAALRDRLRALAAKVGGSDDLIDRRADLLTVWFIGLDAVVRGGGKEAEIDRIIDALHDTVDSWPIAA
jgi:AcrR family transcriptional regulator